jgi:hypothetical protein
MYFKNAHTETMFTASGIPDDFLDMPLANGVLYIHSFPPFPQVKL